MLQVELFEIDVLELLRRVAAGELAVAKDTDPSRIFAGSKEVMGGHEHGNPIVCELPEKLRELVGCRGVEP